MRKTTFTDHQIISILKQQETFLTLVIRTKLCDSILPQHFDLP
jgi:hypothetical protein